MSESLTVYIDESGFTGNNLLDEAQPLFVVAAVAIEQAEAEEIARRVIADFSLKAKELKVSKLLRSSKGAQAMLKALELLAGRYRYIAFNKRYAAVCKAFEYLVEPAISDCSFFFYRQGVHLLFADAIYAATKVESREILSGLSTAIRERDPKKIFDVFGPVPDPGKVASVLSILKESVSNNRDDIIEEFKTIQGFDHARWIMDLSSTALVSLLCTWAETGRPLDVHCDESKPLATFAPAFSGRVGAKSEEFETPNGDRRRMFALAKPIALERSDDVVGLQLADIVAGAAAAVLNDPKTDFARKARPLLVDRIDPGSMYPGARPLTPEQVQRAGDLLVIIAKARTTGMSPCERIRYLIDQAQKRGGG